MKPDAAKVSRLGDVDRDPTPGPHDTAQLAENPVVIMPEIRDVGGQDATDAVAGEGEVLERADVERRIQVPVPRRQNRTNGMVDPMNRTAGASGGLLRPPNRLKL